MSVDFKAIVAAMTAAFAVTFALLWWQRRHQEPPPVAAMPSAPATRIATPPQMQVRTHEAAPLPAPVVPRPSAPPPIEVPPSNTDGPPMPVLFNIVSRLIQVRQDEESDEGVHAVTKKVNEAIVSNSSGELLVVTASEVKPTTRETFVAQFTLPPGGQMYLGSDQGLQMLSGDELTLRSPRYQDVAQEIP